MCHFLLGLVFMIFRGVGRVTPYFDATSCLSAVSLLISGIEADLKALYEIYNVDSSSLM